MEEKFSCAYTEIVDIDKLVENPKNNNFHPDKQVEMLAKIIKYQGQRSPIVVSKRSGFIVKGHGRLLALKKLGYTKVAVDYQDYENEAQEYADMIADNKIAELAEFDNNMMMAELPNLEIKDLQLLGMIEIPQDIDIMSELQDGAFTNKFNDETDIFTISFNFPKDREDKIKEKLKEKSKEFVVNEILKLLEIEG